MKPISTIARKTLPIAVLGWLVSWAGTSGTLAAPGGEGTNEIRIVELQGKVEIIRAGASLGVRTTETNQVLQASDRLRTGPNSRVTLRWSDQSVVSFSALTEIEILPPHAPGSESGLNFLKGLLSFFHRDEPGRIRLMTRGAAAGVKGTEFVAKVETVNGTERTTFSVIDGEVEFGNAQGTLVLTNGQQASAEPGQAPARTAGFIANNVLQWCFYYPAVLDLRDLPLTPEEQNILNESLAAYRKGDLLTALANYPAARQPGSDAERIYHAALLLSVGQVQQTEAALAPWNSTSRYPATNPALYSTGRAVLPAAEPTGRLPRLANALRQLIAAVKRETSPSTIKPQLATEFLAASYYEQSRAVGEISLRNALDLARQAVTNSPEFSFALERVAELEFSFGRTGRALDALNKSLALAPRNAQALALHGFLLAAQNKIREALEQFKQAIAVDSALGNAWLGRGLCRIRRGDTSAGREDLLVAAALEPQRALLRSYLGKAYANAGDGKRARHELDLAKGLDRADPTAWLYSALVNEQENRINESISDLEKSQELNENRRVYRSQLLLDQDRAVRGVNLARIYDEAGLGDVAVREASRAVAADYGNFEAHLFLANSYEQLRRASPFDLRFETPAFSEYLVASLMGPADGRILAQPVTQQEYTRLFERDTLGFSSSTEYLSRGAWSQYAAQYGTLRNSSYALEADYRSDPGETPYRNLESRLFSVKYKQMLTPHDGLFVQVLDFHKDSGDRSQRYDPSQAIAGLKAREKQEADVLVGWDHQWSEAQRTLLLASHFNDAFTLHNPRGGTFLFTETFGTIDGFLPVDLTQEYENRQTVNSFELQHLVRCGQLQTIAGIRFQDGTERLTNEQTINVGNAAAFESYFGAPATVITSQSLRLHATRISPYLYEHWQVADPLWLIAGVAFDYQNQPRNLLFAPLADGTEIHRQFSPKAALVWAPTPRSTVRAAYSRSLAGVDLDQSVRLEPTQLAGFVQAYRNLFPDSLVGGVGGARLETADVSLENRFRTGTYIALSGQWLRSTVDHNVGAFVRDTFTGEGPAVQTSERLRFQESSLDFSLHQLLADWFTVGLRYRLSDAKLNRAYPEVDPALCADTCATSRGLLHLVSLDGLFRHPSGFFAGVEGQWWSQELHENLAGVPEASFWQVNLLAGYRSPRRHVELTIGLLNVAGQGYHLHPINLYPELPRERTFFTRLQLNF